MIQATLADPSAIYLAAIPPVRQAYDGYNDLASIKDDYRDS
jgi:hypothetical protein